MILKYAFTITDSSNRSYLGQIHLLHSRIPIDFSGGEVYLSLLS
jgi:hypothetical protein